MKPSSLSLEQQLVENSAPKIKGAHVFDSQEANTPAQPKVKPAVMVTDLDSIEVTEEPIPDRLPLPQAEELTIKKTGRKWIAVLFAIVLLASGAELAFFILATVEKMDWLAGVWLAIFSVLGIWVLRQIIIEYKGLKQLKRQENIRSQSQQMASTSVIGLAEQHCLKIANSLPKDYQNLVVNWRDSVDSHHSDSEVLSLFEHQVLAPIDRLALKQVSNNASAASVMIAVSPFALLDMLIVLWRNIRMMNQVSAIYGLRLGYWGRISLIRKIFHTMLYAGAAEILSDAGNYALSAGITGKISTRIAQGMGAGVLTARIGLKAINESRPLPWLSEKKPGLSGISKQLLADLNKHLS
ncbi:TIGR01620 family protein [uncultured Paraglaciecola sp.]|uniref:YcjF family protein n=1 Tax=uncultured Paraglaciecola sp. TaxID=1765024 RepID=UPI0030DAA42F|tara:strand:- start:4908 stop:5969 length:1062 start_codon:yes stop_codon:yes gene_type:complete